MWTHSPSQTQAAQVELQMPNKDQEPWATVRMAMALAPCLPLPASLQLTEPTPFSLLDSASYSSHPHQLKGTKMPKQFF